MSKRRGRPPSPGLPLGFLLKFWKKTKETLYTAEIFCYTTISVRGNNPDTHSYNLIKFRYAPVAQLDSASDSDVSDLSG